MLRVDRLLLVLAAQVGLGSRSVDWFEVLDAMGQGDRVALARIRRLVTSQLSRMTAYQIATDWDDFAQEVLIKVWRTHRDGKIRDQRGVPAFVRTTTRNAFIDWQRKHHREVDLDDEALESASEDGATDRPLDPGTQIALRKAIDMLPDRHREVVFCLFLEGRSYDETAEHLGRPRGTINRQQREAMTRLREALSPTGERAKDVPRGQETEQ